MAIDLTNRMADQGQIVAGGFAAYRETMILGASPETVAAHRLVWIAASDHLYSSMMLILNSESEPRDQEMRRMDILHAEIVALRNEMELTVAPIKGRA